MVDIHTHILPNVDDGSNSLELSNDLLKLEYDNGVDVVVFTPHVNAANKDNVSLLKEKFETFKSNYKGPLKLLLGSEIYYYHGMYQDLKDNKCLTINDSNFVLVEFSTRMETDICNIVYEIKRLGYTPIIAHIERYLYLNFNDYLEIKKLGALIQVNAHSFEISSLKKNIKFLMKNKLVDFIASDCHNTKRSVDFSFVKKFVLKKYKDQYDKLFYSEYDFLK